MSWSYKWFLVNGNDTKFDSLLPSETPLSEKQKNFQEETFLLLDEEENPRFITKEELNQILNFGLS